MKYDFLNAIDRSGTSAIKTNENIVKDMFKLNYYDDTISMWVADMDFACPQKVLEAINQRVDRQIFGYTLESDAYYDSIINWYDRRHKMKIQKEWIKYSSGTVTAIRNCLRALTEVGDGVIIQPPVYYPFESQIQDTNRVVIRNDLLKDEFNRYSIDFDDFQKKCQDPKTSMFILCNPHNPIGNIWSEGDVQRLLDICDANNVIVFADEIHCDLIRDGKEFTSALNLKNNQRVLVATAANKTFNVAGLHLTNMIIKDEELREAYSDYVGMVHISPFAMAAMIAAYDECEDWTKELNNVLDANLNMMATFIQEKLPKVKFNKPDGTYLTWLDFKAYNLSEQELLITFAEDARLIVEGGSIFGQDGYGYIRMNIACPQTTLETALNRMYEAFKSKES